jgi:uncharacterized membrane protein
LRFHGGADVLEDLIAWLGFGLCHQLPERSFFGGGMQLPVCARDTGIYVGFAVALLIVWALDRGRRASEVPPLGASIILAGFVVIMMLDGLTSYAGWRETSNSLRLLTGLMTGFALTAFTVPLLNSQLWKRPGPERVLGRRSDLGWYLLGLAVTFVAVYLGGPLLGIAYPLGTTLAILVTFTAVNAVIVALLPVFERRYERIVDAWPVFALAFAVTLAELAGATWLRLWLVRITGASA